MLGRAVFITEVQPGLLTGQRWAMLIDKRREEARELSLAGAVAALDDRVIYALEGEPARLDAFMELLLRSPCETKARAPWRATAQHRRHRVLALSDPRLEPEEVARLREILASPKPDYETATGLLSKAATRSTLQLYPAPLLATPWLVTSST